MNRNSVDYYQELGVSPDAEADEIKKAYRKLSLEFHPDRNKDNPETTAKFQKINEAYEHLSDPQKRNMVDNQKRMEDQGIHGFSGGFPFPGMFPFPHGGGMNIFHGNNEAQNIFETFFGGGGIHMEGMHGPNIRIFHNGRPVVMKPPPVEKRISITLDQAYTGVVVHLEMERRIGSQSIEKETIPVTIPKGVEQDEKIVLKDAGNQNTQNVKGDLILIVSIDPHPVFNRKGLDLHHKTSISLKDALCGFSIEIPHLNGKMLRLSNFNQCNIVKPGYTKEVPSFGMIKDLATGNLIIEFDVVFPDFLDKEIKDILSQQLP